MTIYYVEWCCDICTLEPSMPIDTATFAIYKDGRTVCKNCANPDRVFKWVTPVNDEPILLPETEEEPDLIPKEDRPEELDDAEVLDEEP